MRDITNVNLSAVNLNLLPVLDALLRERSVSRAGLRLGLSQPAVSNALAQLRQLFGDPLLLRGKGAAAGAGSAGARGGLSPTARLMVPTERALALEVPVRTALTALAQGLADPAPFVPARAQRRFVLVMNDFIAFSVLPGLLARVSKEAPGIRIDVHGWREPSLPSELERGEADLALGFRRTLPPGYFEESLFEDRFTCVVREGHPRLRHGKLALRDYLAAGHVLVSNLPNDTGIVDKVLAKRGLTRTIAAQVSHFLLVPAVVASTDYVAALSERVAEPFAASWPLRLVRPPLALPSATVFMTWHARAQHSPAHAWLRAQVQAAVAKPAAARGSRTSGTRSRR